MGIFSSLAGMGEVKRLFVVFLFLLSLLSSVGCAVVVRRLSGSLFGYCVYTLVALLGVGSAVAVVFLFVHTG